MTAGLLTFLRTHLPPEVEKELVPLRAAFSLMAPERFLNTNDREIAILLVWAACELVSTRRKVNKR